MMDAIQRAVPVPQAEVIMHGASGRQILGQRAPLAAGAQNVHHAVDHLADSDAPFAAAGLARRDQRLDMRPFPGLHGAIIDESRWNEVQCKLTENRVERANGARAAQPSLLAGLLYDDTGERMIPSHANKKGTRYRYYVSQGLVKGSRRNAPRGRRVPAGELESLVEDRLTQFLTNETDLYDAIEPHVADVNERTDVVARAADLAGHWPRIEPSGKRAILTTLVERIDLMRETVEARIVPGRLLSILLHSNDYQDRTPPNKDNEPSIMLSIPARLKRTGMETRFLIDGAGSSARRKPDHSLHRVLAQAHQYNAMVMRDHGKTIAKLAAEAGVGGSYFTRILRLSFLAPDAVKAILRDQHPIELTAKRLTNEVRLPIAWEDQHALLGTG